MGNPFSYFLFKPICNNCCFRSIKDLEKNLFFEKIKSLDLKPFENKPVIIKGCSDMTIPEDAYIQLLQRLQTVAKSLFYGEACSSVPLWKVKN